SGLIAVRLRENDELISVRLTDGKKDIGIATKYGSFIRFDEEVVRPMGRNAAGVIGIRLRNEDEVVSMEVIDEDSYILHVTDNGIGKRTAVEEYRRTNRGGLGYFVCRLTEDTGNVVSVKIVQGHEDLMLITVDGVLIRIPVEGIPITGRNTQGVRLIRIRGDEQVATVAKIVDEELDAEQADDEDETADAIDSENNEAEQSNSEVE